MRIKSFVPGVLFLVAGGAVVASGLAIRPQGVRATEPAGGGVQRTAGDPRMLAVDGQVGLISWSADGTRFATAAWLVQNGIVAGAELVIWDANTLKPRRLDFPKGFNGRTAWAQRVALSPDFRRAAAVIQGRPDEKPHVRLFDLADELELDLDTEGGGDQALAFVVDGKTVVQAGLPDGEVRVWGVDRHARLLRTLEGRIGPVESIAVSRDGETLAVATGTEVRLWALREGKTLRSIRLEGASPGTPRPVAFSPNGRMLAVGTSRDEGGIFVGGAVQIYETATGRHLRTLKGHETAVIVVAFSADGGTIASGGWDKTVRRWDAKSGESSQVLACPDEVWAVAFSPDGRTLAAGGQSSSVQLWPISSASASSR